jgi:phosphoglycerate dehydrogenase-like enzyme
MRIAALDDYHRRADSYADWASLEPKAQVDFFHEPIPRERLPEVLAPYDGLVLMRERTAFRKETLEQLPNLKLVITTGMRNAAVDEQYLREHEIVYCGTGMAGYGGDTPGVQGTVEVAWALILALYKRVTFEDRAIREGTWQLGMPRTLAGQTLGLAGLGRLGSQMVAPAKAFGMQVIAWSENLTPQDAAAKGAQHVSKNQLLERADVLSIHLILSRRTRGLFGAEDLQRMKPGAVLVNTSRGPIVEEQALVAGLRAGTPAAAGLDVYDTEPLPADNPLLQLENTVLLPHLGYVSEGGFRHMYSEVVEDIAAYLDGAPIRLVN